MSPKYVYAVATMDTKGAELRYAAERLVEAGAAAKTVDVGVGDRAVFAADVSREEVAACHPSGAEAVLGLSDRGAAVAAMSVALREWALRQLAAGRVAGMLGLGGTGGTALITEAMRALPIGLPKAMVSTVAGSDVSAYVGCSDIAMFPSIVDVAGLNAVSRSVIANAAHALAGMVGNRVCEPDAKPTIGMTMFGVTTPCVDAVRRTLEVDGYDCLVFHATGTGGRTMEKLVESGMIGGVIDVTTTEVADEVVGGIFACRPERFDAILRAGVPYVLSLGALDMVNFGAVDSVPPRFRERRLHVHNPHITLMRTTAEENRRFARWIAEKINRAGSRVTILIPKHGVSALDAPGQPFYDPEADAALFDELENCVDSNESRVIRRLPLHINDPAFAAALVDEYRTLVRAPQERRSVPPS
ncbi:MAG TPA: Tm-1-like ATP-binding domain-containing protein [Pirellulaceae bacterium]|jgi:uncharacterized protein (UPF0261 family)|nr:Tm-1-like ATP-binding domain-containing protein [Pirellulaceae bacterium]